MRGNDEQSHMNASPTHGLNVGLCMRLRGMLNLRSTAVALGTAVVCAITASAATQSFTPQPPSAFADSLKARAKNQPDRETPRLAHETNWLIGDGTVQDAAGGKGKIPASGSVGIRHESAVHELNVLDQVRDASVERFVAFYGFGTSVDTVAGSDHQTFAATILPPSVVGRRLSFSGDYSHLWAIPKKTRRLEQQWGLRVYGGTAKMTWGVDSAASRISGDAVLYDAGARFVVVPINKAHDDNQVVFAIESGPTLRYVDFKGSNRTRMRALTLGGETYFAGWDLVGTLQVRDLVASVYFPAFGSNGRKAGLRDAAPLIQVGIQTGLVKLTDDTQLPGEPQTVKGSTVKDKQNK